MAFKLSKKEEAQRLELAAELRSAGKLLNEKIAELNETLGPLWDALSEAQASYVEKLEEVNSFIEEIASASRSEYDERSERWQEGDTGSAALAWLEAWEGISLEYEEIDMPSTLDEIDAVIEFEELPSAPD